MTSRILKAATATLTITALLTAPLSAFAASGSDGGGRGGDAPALAEEAVAAIPASRAELAPAGRGHVAPAGWRQVAPVGNGQVAAAGRGQLVPAGREQVARVSRGQVVSAVAVARLTAGELDAAAGATGFDGAPRSKYGVVGYRLIYRTVDRDGRATTASGLVVLPMGRRGVLSIAEYLHGTMATRAAAPSVDDASADRLVTAMFAGQGLVGVAPDYLGLGLGPGRHPYIDTETETSASGDLLLAASSFVGRYGVVLRREVLATGFSQGGRAAVNLGRALERGEVGRFRLGALHAVAGPYDLLGTELPAAFDGRLLPATAAFYLAYLTTSWNRTIGLYAAPRDAFLLPYADTVEALFDGTRPYEQIVAGLPDSPEKLFTPKFLAELKHPSGRLLKALRKADQTCDWTPTIPVHLYNGTADTDVAPANTNACAATLAKHGAKVTIHSMGPVDHNGTALAAYPQILRVIAARG